MTFVPVGNQKQAIEHGIDNILVSAAAGSGKTTVLVERIVGKLLSGELTLDKILVVTFTNEAADKAKTDIESKIREKLGDPQVRAAYGDEAVRRLAAQLEMLPGSYIQTMNSFCNRVIKEKGYLCAGHERADLMDPGNTILDGNELKIVLDEAVARAIEDQYAEDTSDAFYELTDMFGNGRTDDLLCEDLAKTYKKLRSLPDYLSVLKESVRKREEADSRGEVIGVTEITGRILRLCGLIDRNLIDGLVAGTASLPIVKDTTIAQKKLKKRQEELADFLEEIYSRCRAMIEFADNNADPMERLEFIRQNAREMEFFNMPATAKKTDDEIEIIDDWCIRCGPIAALGLLFVKCHGGNAKNNYGKYSQSFGLPAAFAEFLARDPAILLDLQKKRTARSRVYARLLENVDYEYMRIKTGLHGMDFSDQEHLAKLILDTEEGSSYYRNKFTEIYIDEYQDNSCLQDAVIELISRPEGNVFRVGDVKQSIYKFRYAEPSLFIGRMEDYAREESDGELILLNYNLRSTPEILDFVNGIFVQIMTKEGAEIEYDESQELKWQTTKEHGDIPRVIISDSSKESEKYETLKRDVLAEVAAYTAMGYKPGEICILTRNCDIASILSEHLNSCGYEAGYVDELSIFADNDIHGVINILICLGNSLRDEYLTGMLLSNYPMTNFTVNEIAKVHAFCMEKDREYRFVSLIDRLKAYLAEGEDEELKGRIKRFTDWFYDLKNDMVITDIGEITDRIYKDTGISSLNGEAGSKMVRFRDWLCDNFTRYGSDIASIAESLEKMKITIGDKTSVEEKRRDKDKISCMTIHSSKGLDFPCVIVAQLYNKGREDKDYEGFVYDGRMGLVSDDYYPGTVKREDSIEKILYKDHEYIASNAEEIRLLYVALTRPKEHLSVVLPINGIESKSALIESVALYGERGFGSSFWLYGKNNSSRKLEYPFLAALLRTRSGEDLLAALASRYEKITRSTVLCPVGSEGPQIIFTPAPETEEDPEGEAGYDEDRRASEDEYPEEYDEGGVSGDPAKVMAHSDHYVKFSGHIDEDGNISFNEYPFSDSFAVPFKVSVTSVSSGEIKRTDSMSLKMDGFDYFLDRRRGFVGDTPAEVGTFVHKLFRFADMAKVSDPYNNYESIIDDLIKEEVIRPEEKEKAMDFEKGITSFARSKIGERLIAADLLGNAEYERPIVFATPVGRDHALVQGVIDCMFTEKNEAVIIDYKTDRFKEEGADARAAAASSEHSFQVDMYAAAVEAAGIKVKEKYLYLVRYGEFVSLP